MRDHVYPQPVRRLVVEVGVELRCLVSTAVKVSSCGVCHEGSVKQVWPEPDPRVVTLGVYGNPRRRPPTYGSIKQPPYRRGLGKRLVGKKATAL